MINLIAIFLNYNPNTFDHFSELFILNCNFIRFNLNISYT